MSKSSPDILLDVENLQAWIEAGDTPVRAVDGVSFSIRRGETFALLGESGCGKSMTALAIMRLLPEPAGRLVSGHVRLQGEDLTRYTEMAMRRIRGNRIAMIFQEPMTSLNPVLTIGAQIGEVLRLHKGLSGAAERKRILELLDDVGIPDAQRRINEYPHQLSGGMKQRVMIAIALACDPELLVADEPEKVGGNDLGPRPHDFLLSALGACTSMTLKMYAGRKEWPLDSVRVTLRHDRIHAKDCEDCDKDTGMIDVIEKNIELMGDLSDEQRGRLLEISARCPVHRTLLNEIKIRSELA